MIMMMVSFNFNAVYLTVIKCNESTGIQYCNFIVDFEVSQFLVHAASQHACPASIQCWLNIGPMLASIGPELSQPDGRE